MGLCLLGIISHQKVEMAALQKLFGNFFRMIVGHQKIEQYHQTPPA